MCCADGWYSTDPDGSNYYSWTTNVSSANGISGISKTGSILFLVGVFLTDAAPGAVGTTNYDNSENTVDFHPAIGQTFIIGDGLTAAGTAQQFYIPTGATRLYMGFADSAGFQGTNGYYQDNYGSYQFAISLSDPPAHAPEPATVLLVSSALVGLAFRARRRRA